MLIATSLAETSKETPEGQVMVAGEMCVAVGGWVSLWPVCLVTRLKLCGVVLLGVVLW